MTDEEIEKEQKRLKEISLLNFERLEKEYFQRKAEIEKLNANANP